jgi:hypothetical protein
VKQICEQHCKQSGLTASKLKPPSKRRLNQQLVNTKRFGKLRPEHIDYLCSQETLQQQVGWNLEQRAAAFNRLHSDVRITSNQLKYQYRLRGIRRKAILNTKLLTPKQIDRYGPLTEEVRQRVKQAIADKRTLVYCDEVCFTTSSILKRAYSNLHQNLCVDYQNFYMETTAVIAAVSAD